jgi:hypothetical protein
VRVAVDLVAGTHMLALDWSLAQGLYMAVAQEMGVSADVQRQGVAAQMELRAGAVSLVRDRADMAFNDALSSQAEALYRDPDLAEALRIGKTGTHLASLLSEQSQVSSVGRRQFKQFVGAKGGALPTLLSFFMAVAHFRALEDDDHPDFAPSCKRINKKYIKPPSKLPMLTQGIRADLADAMRAPALPMFDAAQKLVLDTLFAAAFGGGTPWVGSPEGRLWKWARDVGLDPGKERLVRSLQLRVRFEHKVRAKRAAAMAATTTTGARLALHGAGTAMPLLT